MVYFLWRIFPTKGIRLAVTIAIAAAVSIVLACRYIGNVYRNTYNSKIKRYFAMIGSAAVFLSEILLGYSIAQKMGYHVDFAGNISNSYIFYMIYAIVIYTVDRIRQIVFEAIWTLKQSGMSSKYESACTIIYIIGLVFITKMEMGKMKSLYNHVDGGYDEVNLIFISLVFLGINILLSYGFKKLRKIRKYEKEMAVMQLQREVQLQKYIELNNQCETSGKIIHDIKKHLDMLDLLMGKDNEKAREYRRQIAEKMDSLAEGFRCSNRILSVIISQKLLETEEKKIKVKIDMMDVNFDFLKDMDITSIFVNLWDNAIEASEKIEIEDRFIYIIIGKVMDFILVSFENHYSGNVEIDGNVIQSKKKGMHGFGLKIVEETVKKYGGTLKISLEEGMFQAQIIFPIQKE